MSYGGELEAHVARLRSSFLDPLALLAATTTTATGGRRSLSLGESLEGHSLHSAELSSLRGSSAVGRESADYVCHQCAECNSFGRPKCCLLSFLGAAMMRTMIAMIIVVVAVLVARSLSRGRLVHKLSNHFGRSLQVQVEVGLEKLRNFWPREGERHFVSSGTGWRFRPPIGAPVHQVS